MGDINQDEEEIMFDLQTEYDPMTMSAGENVSEYYKIPGYGGDTRIETGCRDDPDRTVADFERIQQMEVSTTGTGLSTFWLLE